MSDSEKIGELFASLEDGSATLADADGLALQVSDQNARYQEATDILKDEPEILELVQFGIAEEQEETFANILAIAPESGRIFESLGRTCLAIENGLKSADAQASELVSAVKKQEAALEEQHELKQQQAQLKTEELLANVERLAPRAVETVKELLESRGTRPISDQEINDLEDRVLELMDQEDEAKRELEKIKASFCSLDAIVGQLAVSWELPLALMNQDRSIFAILDELPVDPVLTDHPSRDVRQFTERHVDQPKAALYTAICLSEHSGQTVTVDQIAKALYSPEVIKKLSEYHLRARVTTTLGPKVGGENLRDILDKEGYVLQYGWRRTLEQKPDGHVTVVRRQRIYRAIHKKQVVDFVEMNSFEGEGYIDSFEALRIYDESETTSPSPRISAETSETTAKLETTQDTHDKIEDEATLGTDLSLTNDRHETNSQRKERLKNELLAAITGSARSIIKTIGDHGAIEGGGIKFGHLRNIFIGSEITDDEFRHVVSNRVTPTDGYWLRSVDAVRLMLSVTLEDEATRVSVGSRQWQRVVNQKINELVQRELRGIERRRNLQSQQ